MASVAHNNVGQIGKNAGVPTDGPLGIAPNSLLGTVEPPLTCPLKAIKGFFRECSTEDNVILAVINKDTIVLHESTQTLGDGLHPVTNEVAFHCGIVVPKRAALSDVKHGLCRAPVQETLVGIGRINGLDEIKIIRESRDVSKESSHR